MRLDRCFDIIIVKEALNSGVHGKQTADPFAFWYDHLRISDLFYRQITEQLEKEDVMETVDLIELIVVMKNRSCIEGIDHS